MYPEEIAPIVNRTPGAINRFLSLEKKRGIIHERLKPRHTKYDKQTVGQWRELRKQGLTYPKMSELLHVHPVKICIMLGKEATNQLVY